MYLQSKGFKSSQFLRLVVGIFATGVLLWSQAETGQITGNVLDPSGSVVPNAGVRLVGNANGFERTTTSNDSGSFIFTNLQLETTQSRWKRAALHPLNKW